MSDDNNAPHFFNAQLISIERVLNFSQYIVCSLLFDTGAREGVQACVSTDHRRYPSDVEVAFARSLRRLLSRRRHQRSPVSQQYGMCHDLGKYLRTDGWSCCDVAFTDGCDCVNLLFAFHVPSCMQARAQDTVLSARIRGCIASRKAAFGR